MVRAFTEELLLFLTPFALFALWLVLKRRSPLRWAHWSEGAFWLVVTGLSLALASLVIAGLTGERHAGGFVPTHMENGRVVPGEFR